MEFVKSVRSYKIIYKNITLRATKTRISNRCLHQMPIIYHKSTLVCHNKKRRRVKYLYVDISPLSHYYILCKQSMPTPTPPPTPKNTFHFEHHTKKVKFSKFGGNSFLFHFFRPIFIIFSSLLLFCGNLKLVCLKTNVM